MNFAGFLTIEFAVNLAFGRGFLAIGDENMAFPIHNMALCDDNLALTGNHPIYEDRFPRQSIQFLTIEFIVNLALEAHILAFGRGFLAIGDDILAIPSHNIALRDNNLALTAPPIMKPLPSCQ